MISFTRRWIAILKLAMVQGLFSAGAVSGAPAAELSKFSRLIIVKASKCLHMHCVPNRPARRTTTIAALLGFLGFSSMAISADRKCFVPMKSSGDNSSNFVEPKSKVCRAFQRELNANCAGEIPTVEFKPSLRDSGLTEPAWEPIALYTQDGNENSDAFALLEKLIWSRAVLGHSSNQEAAARRDVEVILGTVRTARAGNRVPRFEKVSLDVEGRGRMEVIYRLYSGLLHNPMSINEQNSAFKSEPNLFLERALSLARNEDLSKISSHSAGHDATGLADVILFDGAPYFLRWGAYRVLIYASYLRRNRPKIPGENAAIRTYIMPKLRCVFESHPTH